MPDDTKKFSFIVTNVSFVPFFVFCHFWRLSYENTKYFVIFACILQGKMGKTEKKKRKSRNESDQKPKDKNVELT